MTNKFAILIGVDFTTEYSVKVDGFITCCNRMIQHILELNNVYIKTLGPSESFIPRLYMKGIETTAHGHDKPMPLNYCPFCGGEVICADSLTLNRIVTTTEVNVPAMGHFRNRTAHHITAQDVINSRHPHGG